jgi:hypothetical protein
MSNTNDVRELRGPKYGNWPLGDPRAAAPGKYDLKSGENGHLARANGAAGGPYCSPSLPSACGRQFEPLAGRGGGFGARSCTDVAVVALWALLQIECLRKPRYPGLPALPRKTWPGWLRYVHCSPEGAGAHYATYRRKLANILHFFEPAAIGSLPVTPSRG